MRIYGILVVDKHYETACHLRVGSRTCSPSSIRPAYAYIISPRVGDRSAHVCCGKMQRHHSFWTVETFSEFVNVTLGTSRSRITYGCFGTVHAPRKLPSSVEHVFLGMAVRMCVRGSFVIILSLLFFFSLLLLYCVSRTDSLAGLYCSRW